jgi:hypothetical protein
MISWTRCKIVSFDLHEDFIFFQDSVLVHHPNKQSRIWKNYPSFLDQVYLNWKLSWLQNAIYKRFNFSTFLLMMLTFNNFEIFHYCFKYDFALDAIDVIKT